MSTASVEQLTDNEWASLRETITRRYLGISADEFVERFNAGDFDDASSEFLMTVLGYFPELD